MKYESYSNMFHSVGFVEGSATPKLKWWPNVQVIPSYLAIPHISTFTILRYLYPKL